MSYRNELLDVQWQRKRLETLEAASWRCEHCHRATGQLHVHHTLYVKDRRPWEYERDYLVVLCDQCHAERHEHEPKLKAAMAVLLKKVPGRRLVKVAQHLMTQALEATE